MLFDLSASPCTQCDGNGYRLIEDYYFECCWVPNEHGECCNCPAMVPDYQQLECAHCGGMGDEPAPPLIDKTLCV